MRDRAWKTAAMLAALLAGPAAGAVSPLPAQFMMARSVKNEPIEVANRVTVVNYWATWCVPCRVEMPILDAFYRHHRDAGLMVVAVAVDAGSPVGRLRKSASAFAMPIVALAATRVPRRDIPNGIPVTRVYDRRGTLRFDSSRDGKGTVDAATLDRVVLPLLAER